MSAEKMKVRLPHIVVLPKQAAELFNELYATGDDKYVFPSDRDSGSHSNTQTANMALKRMVFGGG